MIDIIKSEICYAHTLMIMLFNKQGINCGIRPINNKINVLCGVGLYLYCQHKVIINILKAFNWQGLYFSAIGILYSRYTYIQMKKVPYSPNYVKEINLYIYRVFFLRRTLK